MAIGHLLCVLETICHFPEVGSANFYFRLLNTNPQIFLANPLVSIPVVIFTVIVITQSASANHGLVR
jgi:hypothetical protein